MNLSSTAKVVCLAIAMMALNSMAVAMEFKIHKNESSTLTAIFGIGDIHQGDAKRLANFLRSRAKKKNTAIYLSSQGGDLYEGIRLGYFFWSRKIKTVVEGGSMCASSCALAFLGGRDTDGESWRSSSDNSQLGFHAFSRPGENPTIDEVLKVVADVLTYGQEVNAPLQILIKKFATPSDSMFWLTQAQICRLGIKLWSNKSNKFLC